MKSVIILRHGDHSNGNLTELGIRQAKLIAKKIMELVGDAEYNIYTSPVPRAVETAQVIIDILGCCNLESRKELDCYNYQTMNYFEEKKGAVLNSDHDRIEILVTHQPNIDGVAKVNGFRGVVIKNCEGLNADSDGVRLFS